MFSPQLVNTVRGISALNRLDEPQSFVPYPRLLQGCVMANKKSPLRLNPLQLRTLTLLQVLANVPEAAGAGPEEGEITISRFPQPHADHFHLGDAVVMGRDATGLFNQAVWNALHRKGLVKAAWPNAVTLTAAGLAYDTGEARGILHRSGH
jgi:hypothetical protein